jgi:hypothetical protein
LVDINLKRIRDKPVGKVDLISLGALDLEEIASQGNSLLDKGNPM